VSDEEETPQPVEVKILNHEKKETTPYDEIDDINYSDEELRMEDKEIKEFEDGST